MDNLVKKFKDSKAGIENLEDTDIYLIHFKGRIFPVIKGYTPKVPYIYGIFFLSDGYIEEILRENKILYKRKLNGNTEKVFISAGGYYKGPKNSKIQLLSRKILNCFPNLGYLMFEVDKNCTAGNFSVSLQPHFSEEIDVIVRESL